MKRFIIKISVYAGMLVAFLVIYALFCENLFKNNDYYLGNSKRYWQLSQKDQEVDYLVLGSSRAYGSLDVSLLDSIIGKKGINLGLNGSGFTENFVTLKLFLENGNKADFVFLQVDPYSLMSDRSFSNSFHSYAYLPFWDKDKEIKNVLHANNPILKKWPFYPPLLAYFIYNNYYSPYNVYKGLKNNGEFCGYDFDCSNGNKRFNVSTQNKEINGEEILIEPNSNDILYYEKILNLAEENNMEIISYMAPTLDNFPNYDSIEVLRSINYKTSDSINKSRFYSDATHMNESGRRIFTSRFGEFLLSY